MFEKKSKSKPNPELEALLARIDALTTEVTRVQRELRNGRTVPAVPVTLRQRSVESSVHWIESDPRFANARISLDKPECRAAALQSVKLDGMVAEFGVYKGEAMTQIARRFPDKTVHGFDSFAGLPESWSGTAKGAGAFDVGGKPPELTVKNVEFHVGWFDTTVPAFAKAHSGPFAFCHLDADLYSSTKTIFDHLEPWFVPGTVIVFDEYFGYYGWQHHEHRAFQEFLSRTGLSFEAVSIGHMNLGVRLTDGDVGR